MCATLHISIHTEGNSQQRGFSRKKHQLHWSSCKKKKDKIRRRICILPPQRNHAQIRSTQLLSIEILRNHKPPRWRWPIDGRGTNNPRHCPRLIELPRSPRLPRRGMEKASPNGATMKSFRGTGVPDRLEQTTLEWRALSDFTLFCVWWWYWRLDNWWARDHRWLNPTIWGT